MANLHKENFSCDDCLGSIVEDEIDKSQSRYERRHLRNKKKENKEE